MSADTDSIRENVAYAYSALGAIALHNAVADEQDERIVRAFVQVVGYLSAIELAVDSMTVDEMNEMKIESVLPKARSKKAAG